jgi:hypothetical protein
VPAFLVCVVVFVSVSLLTAKKDPPKVLCDIDGNLLEMKKPFGLIPLREAFSRHSKNENSVEKIFE